jgi:hypothetical protein
MRRPLGVQGTIEALISGKKTRRMADALHNSGLYKDSDSRTVAPVSRIPSCNRSQFIPVHTEPLFITSSQRHP